MTEGTNKTAGKNKKRKIIIIVILALSLLSLVSWVLTEHSDWVAGLFAAKSKKKGASVMYSDELRSYAFYKTDYDLDPTQDEEYMGLDRQLWYHSGGVGIGGSLEDDEAWNGYNDAVTFFVKYFKTVIAGDTDAYNALFTKAYYRKNDEHIRFAPQMLYDIHVYQLSESTDNSGVTEWTFSVEYKIHRNDGTFRNDIPSDGSRALLFTLRGDASGNVLIDSIERYRSN